MKKKLLILVLISLTFQFFAYKDIYVFRDENIKETIKSLQYNKEIYETNDIYRYGIFDKISGVGKDSIVAFNNNRKYTPFFDNRREELSYLELEILCSNISEYSAEFSINLVSNKTIFNSGNLANESPPYIVTDIYFMYSLDGNKDILFHQFDTKKYKVNENKNYIQQLYAYNLSTGNSNTGYDGAFWTYDDIMKIANRSTFHNSNYESTSFTPEAQIATSQYETFDNKVGVWNTLLLNFFAEPKFLSKPKKEILKDEGDLINIAVATKKYSDEIEEIKGLYGIGFNVYTKGEFGFYNKYIKTFEIYDIISF